MVTRENITSKQRAALKSMASTMSPIAQIGKGGITDNLLKMLSDALEARELIKVNILPNSDDDARNLAENVADLLDAIPVAVEEGLRFAIREGGRTVGSGVVTKVLK